MKTSYIQIRCNPILKAQLFYIAGKKDKSITELITELIQELIDKEEINKCPDMKDCQI